MALATMVACLHNSAACLRQLRADLTIDNRASVPCGRSRTRPVACSAASAERCLVCMTDGRLWPEAAGLVVQLTKAGFLPAVEQQWWTFFGAHHACGRRGDGRFVLADTFGRSVRRRAEVEVVGEFKTQDVVLLWQSSRSKASGSYLFGELCLFAAEYDGFYPCEGEEDKSFCWSDGPRSRLVVPLVQGRGYRMTIRAGAILLPGQPQVMTVLLNGQTVGKARFDRSNVTENTFELPAAHVRDCNEIVFSYAYTECPMREGCARTGGSWGSNSAA